MAKRKQSKAKDAERVAQGPDRAGNTDGGEVAQGSPTAETGRRKQGSDSPHLHRQNGREVAHRWTDQDVTDAQVVQSNQLPEGDGEAGDSAWPTSVCDPQVTHTLSIPCSCGMSRHSQRAKLAFTYHSRRAA
jgi:hypothetical protein